VFEAVILEQTWPAQEAPAAGASPHCRATFLSISFWCLSSSCALRAIAPRLRVAP